MDFSLFQEFGSADGKVIAKFLPPNVTSLIESMNQGVLVSIKCQYQLEELVLEDSKSLVDVLSLLKVLETIVAS